VRFEQLARLSPQHRTLRDVLAHEHEAIFRVGEAKLLALQEIESARAPTAQQLALLARDIDRFAHEMRDHIVREEDILYSGAERLLEASDWRHLESLRETPDPLDGKNHASHAYPALRAYLAQPERLTHGNLLSTTERLGIDSALDRFGDGVAWMRRASSMGPGDKVWLGMRAMWVISLAASPWPWWRLVATALGPGFVSRQPSSNRHRRRAPRRSAR
jgi:hypothetical protein